MAKMSRETLIDRLDACQLELDSLAGTPRSNARAHNRRTTLYRKRKRLIRLLTQPPPTRN